MRPGEPIGMPSPPPLDVQELLAQHRLRASAAAIRDAARVLVTRAGSVPWASAQVASRVAEEAAGLAARLHRAADQLDADAARVGVTGR